MNMELEMMKDAAICKLENIRRNIDRGIQLIQLDAPVVIFTNEIRMIQWRALAAEAHYEEYIEKKEDGVQL